MSDLVDWSANLKFTFSALSEHATKIQWFLRQKIGESPKQGSSLPVSWDISPALIIDWSEASSRRVSG
jgi:hypothetical protein